MTARRMWLLILLWPALPGCESVGYYGQAIGGQLSVIHQQQSIDSVLAKDDTDEKLAQQLKLVQDIRQFAEDQLALPAGKHFLRYANLQRDHVVWNVYAAQSDSLETKTWCFPIAGCASYRGYFSEQRAQTYADKLDQQGFDTYVAGVAAYSTLGWFNDPVLNTFIYRKESRLAELIFHELAHQVLYVPGNTVFNESFATSVARAGVQRWMLARQDGPGYQIYMEENQQREQFVQLVIKYRKRLLQAYAENDDRQAKLEAKQHFIMELRTAYNTLDQQLAGELPYDQWINSPINNAKLNTISFYHELVPGLSAALAAENYDFQNFYSYCKALAAKPLTEQQAQLNI